MNAGSKSMHANLNFYEQNGPTSTEQATVSGVATDLEGVIQDTIRNTTLRTSSTMRDVGSQAQGENASSNIGDRASAIAQKLNQNSIPDSIDVAGSSSRQSNSATGV